jgi:phosphatidylinositol-3-phosphatase
VKHLWKILALSVLSLLFAMPVATQAQTQMSKVKHVFIILMENHNWTGDNSAASAGDPDLKGSSSAPYINSLIPLRAHAEQYFNPPGNHPSLPNYLWLEGGTNFGVTADVLPSAGGQTTTQHLVTQLVNHSPAVTWKAYAEPDFGNSDFTDCPQDFNELDVNHVPFAYFSDTTDGFSTSSPNCIAHVVPYSHLATDLASGTVAQYNFITPNLCHDGHEAVSPCASGENSDNTRRGDDWLSVEVPKILNSTVYQTDGALFILWDEAEDGGNFSDGPIGMFVLSPFAKTNYQNSIHYDHSSMVKTFQEIFGVTPLLGGAANSGTNDLSDFFLAGSPPTLTSISVTPTSASIAAGATQAFTATGTFSDGSTQNLSSTATWASSNTAVATLSTAGVATGVAAGTANITAAQSGVTSNTAVLTVTAPFSFSAANGGSTSVTVTAGQVATFDLQLNPLGGFTGSVSLACSGAPTRATCTVSPSPATVNSASAAPFTVTVTTTARALAAAVTMGAPVSRVPQWPTPVTALTLALAFGSLTRVRRLKPVRVLAHIGVLLACLTLLNACGGGSSSTPPPPLGGTPAGTYTLTVTGTSGGASGTINLTLTVN